MTLLESALQVPVNMKNKKLEVTDEMIDLSIAMAKGEVKLTQVAAVLNKKKDSALSDVFRTFYKAVASGKLVKA